MNYRYLGLLVAALVTPSAISQQLEEIIVTASPLGKTERELVGALNVLQGEDLRREATTTLGDTLQNQVGVASGSFGPGVGNPVIRGLGEKRVEVLQNNIRVGDVSDISADHNVATEALIAERIEILRGPSTLRYGPGAIGGVVNVIDSRIHDEPIEGAQGAVEARFNTNNNQVVLVGRSDIGYQNWVLHLDALKRQSGDVSIPGLADHEANDPDETTRGYIGNSDTDADSWSTGLSWIGRFATAGMSVNVLQNNYGIPPGAHAHGHHEENHQDEQAEEEPGVRIQMDQTNWQSRFSFINLPDGLDRLDTSVSLTTYRHLEIEEEAGVNILGTRYDSRSRELKSELLHDPIAGWRGFAGLNFSDNDFSARGEEAFVPPSESRVWGLYLVEERILGANSTLELGGRWDRQNIASSDIADIEHDSFNLSASYLLHLTDEHRMGVILSRAQRAPVAEELLANGEHVATGAYEIGDANLDVESSLNLEISYVYQKRGTYRATIYFNDFGDYLYRQDTELLFNHELEGAGAEGLDACALSGDFDDPQEAVEAIECFIYSQEDARFTGLELEADIPLNDFHSLRLWGDLVRARFDQSGDVPRIPPTRVGASWEYQSNNWMADISLLKAFDQSRAGEGQESTNGYVRLDAFISFQPGEWEVFVKGSNLTDEEIRNSASFLRDVAPEPGRTLSLGARYSF